MNTADNLNNGESINAKRLGEAESILENVAYMRRLQKEYFKKKDALILKECKQCEKDIDKALTEYWDRQTSLF